MTTEPAPETPTQKRRFNKRMLIAVAVAVLSAIIAFACSGKQPSSNEGSEDTAAADISQESPFTGRDGKFEFTVVEVSRQVSSSDVELLQKQAKGEYVNVLVNVKNVGDKAQSFSTDDQKLYVGDTEYSSESGFDVTSYEPINPGLDADFNVLFDVPVGSVPTSLKLHDSMFSNGVVLALP